MKVDDALLLDMVLQQLDENLCWKNNLYDLRKPNDELTCSIDEIINGEVYYCGIRPRR